MLLLESDLRTVTSVVIALLGSMNAC